MAVNDSSPASTGVAAADQMAFGQQVPLDIGGVIDIDTPDFFAKVDRQQGFLETIVKLQLALDGQTRQEFIPGDITGQPDARGDDDIGNGVGAAPEP
jgi:hypothetical protein